MAYRSSSSQFATVHILVISVALICLSEGVTAGHAPSPAPVSSPPPPHHAPPPSAAPEFSPGLLVSVLLAALMPLL